LGFEYGAEYVAGAGFAARDCQLSRSDTATAGCDGASENKDFYALASSKADLCSDPSSGCSEYGVTPAVSALLSPYFN